MLRYLQMLLENNNSELGKYLFRILRNRTLFKYNPQSDRFEFPRAFINSEAASLLSKTRTPVVGTDIYIQLTEEYLTIWLE